MISVLIFRLLMTFQGPETHLDRQGVLKNVVLGTKNIEIRSLWPNLALGKAKIALLLGKDKMGVSGLHGW